MKFRTTHYDASGQVIQRPPDVEAPAISRSDIARCLLLVEDQRAKVAIDLLANIGLSVKQVIDLRWGDYCLDLDAPDGPAECLRIRKPYGPSAIIALPLASASLLRAYRFGRDTPMSLPILRTWDRKFRNQPPRPLTSRTLYKLVRDAFANHLGLSLVTPMDLKGYYVRTRGNRKHSLKLHTAWFTPDPNSESSRADHPESLASLWFSDEDDWDPE